MALRYWVKVPPNNDDALPNGLALVYQARCAHHRDISRRCVFTEHLCSTAETSTRVRRIRSRKSGADRIRVQHRQLEPQMQLVRIWYIICSG